MRSCATERSTSLSPHNHLIITSLSPQKHHNIVNQERDAELRKEAVDVDTDGEVSGLRAFYSRLCSLRNQPLETQRLHQRSVSCCFLETGWLGWLSRVSRAAPQARKLHIFIVIVVKTML